MSSRRWSSGSVRMNLDDVGCWMANPSGFRDGREVMFSRERWQETAVPEKSRPAADEAPADQWTPPMVSLLACNRRGWSMCGTREVDLSVGQIEMKSRVVVSREGDETCCSLLLSMNSTRLHCCLDQCDCLVVWKGRTCLDVRPDQEALSFRKDEGV